jgi:oxygen-independent coproporphyrinogen III oxidase
MSGIYIHIPFCAKACHYCNFHFSTSLKYKDDMIAAIIKEIKLRKDYFDTKDIETIYFGGGTPSLLSTSEINEIIAALDTVYDLSNVEECTLEANPDNLTKKYILSLQNTLINRLSIGVQSFHDSELEWMNRSHNTAQTHVALQFAQDKGLSNISIDLIYGVENSTLESWAYNLEQLSKYNIQHLSPYCLTVEPKTALDSFIKKGIAKPLDESKAIEQFEILLDFAAKNGYEHYEISNFAKEGFIAKHNTAYWHSKPYIGLGPSAHSYDGISRQWNIANNGQYLKSIEENTAYFEKEILNIDTRFNEHVMTKIRTKWGVNLEDVIAFGSKFLAHFEVNISKLESQNLVKKNGNIYLLTKHGKLYADKVAMELFI